MKPEQAPSLVTAEAPMFFAPLADRVDFASHDQRVSRMGAAFGRGEFDYDEIEVATVAIQYNLTPEEVLEGACLRSRLRLVEAIDG